MTPDDDVSPYLKLPLRTLEEVLAARAANRNPPCRRFYCGNPKCDGDAATCVACRDQ
jgi:hypothetical protein